MELQHFSHEHPLILKKVEVFCEEDEDPLMLKKEQGFCDDDGNFHRCHGCLEPIFSSPLYSCSQCSFFLHKLCAELPRVHIKHPLHPDHPLTLLAKPLYNCYCDWCDSKWENFTYHCSICKFDLDLVCASLTDLRIEHPSHKHSLTRTRRPVSSLCDGCGIKQEGIFYICNSCPRSFLIHQDCVSLPITINIADHHEHPLNLAYSIPSQYSIFFNYCDICTEEVEDAYAAYYCGECRYFAHVYCATSKYEPFMSILIPWSKAKVKVQVEDPRPGVVQLPVSDESVNLLSHFGQAGLIRLGGQREEEEREREGSSVVGQLIHFSHDHPLILFNYKHGDDPHEWCVACMKPVTTVAPFYRCIEQCSGYFLHKFCAELPTEVQHPGHPEHPLTLLPRSPSVLGVFVCSACSHYCNGFIYRCANCEYDVDVQCGSLPMSIQHEAHKEHILSRKAHLSSRCRASGIGSTSSLAGDFGAYRCDQSCSFEVLPFFIQIPQEIRHRYDELHPFILSYSPVKGHTGEYICDICENELDPKRWFYHCVNCDQSLHVTCVPQFDYWSHLKFGSTLTIDRHPHPLTFVPVIPPNTWFHKFPHVITIGTKCDSIGECVRQFSERPYALKCLECNFKLHPICALENKDDSILED